MKNIRKIICCLIVLIMLLGMACVTSFASSGSTVTVEFDYSEAEGTDSDINHSGRYPAFIKDGTPKTPKISVKEGTRDLIKGTEYYVLYYLDMTGAPVNQSENPFSGYNITSWQNNCITVQVAGMGAYEGKFSEESIYFISYNVYYDITFHKNDGSGEKETAYRVPYGYPIGSGAIPKFERDGFAFAGWYKDAACTDGNEFDVTQPVKKPPENVYAKWIKAVTKVELTMPKLYAGDGYKVEEYGGAVPYPTVKAPSDAPYEVLLTQYVIEDEEGFLGIDVPTKAATFKEGDIVLIEITLEPADGYCFEEISRDNNNIDITIVNGAETTPRASYAFTYYDDETGEADGTGLIVVAAVKVQAAQTLPPTGDTNPATMVIMAILSISLAITLVYEQIKERLA